MHAHARTQTRVVRDLRGAEASFCCLPEDKKHQNYKRTNSKLEYKRQSTCTLRQNTINTINFSDLTYKLGKLKEKAMKLFMHRTKITRLNASKSTTAGLLNEGIFLSRVCERRNVSTVATPRKRTTTRHRVLRTLARLATVNELTRHLVLACSICKDNFRYSTFQGHWYMAKT